MRGASSIPTRAEPGELALVDWRRTIFALYAEIRVSKALRFASQTWREVRDDLFARHPQSPLPEAERAAFRGLSYFEYDPAARVLADVAPVQGETFELPSSTGEAYRFSRFGLAEFELRGEQCSLELYWLEGYGGGICLPFADATSGDSTYGAGRYLLDTIKGADLGTHRGRLVLDFNFAYNPSCAYDPRWTCPLAPPANRLPIEIRAGERVP